MKDSINDIGGAIVALNNALRKHGFDGVGRIVLMSWEDGMRLRQEIEPYMIETAMDPESGKPLMQISIAGVLVQWEPMRRARINGGFDFV